MLWRLAYFSSVLHNSVKEHPKVMIVKMFFCSLSEDVVSQYLNLGSSHWFSSKLSKLVECLIANASKMSTQ